jgi:hypothetical protein
MSPLSLEFLKGIKMDFPVIRGQCPTFHGNDGGCGFPASAFRVFVGSGFIPDHFWMGYKIKIPEKNIYS